MSNFAKIVKNINDLNVRVAAAEANIDRFLLERDEARADAARMADAYDDLRNESGYCGYNLEHEKLMNKIQSAEHKRKYEAKNEN